MATAPTTANTIVDPLSPITHAASRIGAVLRIIYRAHASAAMSAALFVDAETVARPGWLDVTVAGAATFVWHVVATDTTARQYAIRIAGSGTLRRRSFSIEELIAS